MKRAWDHVAELTRVNARHVKQGWRLADITPAQELKGAAGALLELAAAPGDVSELADVLGCLIGYAVKMGWTAEAVEQALLDKLLLRFEEVKV